MSTNRIANDTERTIIENMLDRNREALIETARGLSDADARRRLVASLTTPISLIKHAAAAERIWFQRFWAGLDESLPGIGVRQAAYGLDECFAVAVEHVLDDRSFGSIGNSVGTHGLSLHSVVWLASAV